MATTRAPSSWAWRMGASWKWPAPSTSRRRPARGPCRRSVRAVAPAHDGGPPARLVEDEADGQPEEGEGDEDGAAEQPRRRDEPERGGRGQDAGEGGDRDDA